MKDISLIEKLPHFVLDTSPIRACASLLRTLLCLDLCPGYLTSQGVYFTDQDTALSQFMSKIPHQLRHSSTLECNSVSLCVYCISKQGSYLSKYGFATESSGTVNFKFNIVHHSRYIHACTCAWITHIHVRTCVYMQIT